MMTDTAVGYVRLSQQSDRLLAAQREDIEEYCTREGLSLGEISNCSRWGMASLSQSVFDTTAKCSPNVVRLYGKQQFR